MHHILLFVDKGMTFFFNYIISLSIFSDFPFKCLLLTLTYQITFIHSETHTLLSHNLVLPHPPNPLS